MCCVVALLCCAALLCCHCPAPSSGYNTELLHRWVDTLSSYPQGTMCCVVALLCCAALRCCTVLHCVTVVGPVLELQHRVVTAVLYCCVVVLCCTVVLSLSGTLFELQHRVVTPWLDLTVNTVR